MPQPWVVLLVEDDAETRRQIKEYFADILVDSRPLTFHDIEDFEAATGIIRERKADLVILDIYKGDARRGGERAGLTVLDQIKSSGFVAVVIYTNLPEGLEGAVNSVVRLCPKIAGLPALREAIETIFAKKIPQIHRAIVGHVDRTLRDYMWGFVLQNWEAFAELVASPDFVRLLLQRLALALAQDSVAEVASEVYGDAAATGEVGNEVVHPAQFYIKPPIAKHPMLGDVRYRAGVGGRKEYLVILEPSCDMVTTRKTADGKLLQPKATDVLCARATEFLEQAQVQAWIKEGGKEKENQVREYVLNTKSDQYHFLPGVWDIPSLLVDFRMLEYVAFATVAGMPCLATLASPYAESLGVRFIRYRSRVGTPDLDVAHMLKVLKPPPR